jgi:alanine racemase
VLRLSLIRPCWVEVNARALEENFRVLAAAAAPHAELLAIVKADAYGHSLALCAPAAVRAGAQWLGVTSVEEGVEARKHCPTARILAISGAFPGQGAAVLAHKLTPVVWDATHFDELEAAARAACAAPLSVPVHLEIDTGMSRQGITPEETAAALKRFTPQSPLFLEGVMTHLFAADEADGRITSEQLARLETSLEALAAAHTRVEWLNVGSSAALLGGQAPVLGALATRYGMKALMRPGFSLYGLAPRFNAEPVNGAQPLLDSIRHRLQSVLAWKTRVVSLRYLAPGDTVGYNATFTATEPMRVALLAVGYADGLSRTLGNRFSLLVRGQRAPLVGRISMDQAVVDVTEIPGVAAGDEVVLIGTQGAESISAFDHAEAAGTIPWEIFTRIGPRVPRIAV